MLKFLKLFSKKIDNNKNLNVVELMEHINMKRFYIRNGVSLYDGTVVDPELFENKYLEVGIGRTRSGFGDWGGGATHSLTYPIAAIIDKDFNIMKIDYDSFYNSDDSKEVEQKCREFVNNRTFEKLEMPIESNLYKTLLECFKFLGVKKHMGVEGVFEDNADGAMVFD